jgi:hypothetical protein
VIQKISELRSESIDRDQSNEGSSLSFARPGGKKTGVGGALLIQAEPSWQVCSEPNFVHAVPVIFHTVSAMVEQFRPRRTRCGDENRELGRRVSFTRTGLFNSRIQMQPTDRGCLGADLG